MLSELAKKVGESFINPEQYVLVPLLGNGDRKDSSETDNQLAYIINSIDYSTLVKNLKTNTIELRERTYVDKPMGKKKEIAIES